jgi:hypothetical protein
MRVWVVFSIATLTWLAGCSGDITPAGDGPPANGPGSADGGGLGPNGSGGAGAGRGGGPGGNAGSGAGAGVLAAESVARRLSRAELDNTLRDLLGDDSAPASQLLTEDAFTPYDNDYTSQTASGALIDSLELLASDVAARVVGDSALRARLVPCTPSSAGDEACFRSVVESFALRAFRRPLLPGEVDSYLPLLDFATEDNPDVPHDFYTAVGLVVQAVVQDPEFLYRIEVGTDTGDGVTFALSDYELAARMSYLLWGTTPDDALLTEADQGKLVDATEREAIAQRMLDDDRAREQVHRFHAMWLGYRALPHPPELTSAFQRETTALLDRIVFDEPQSYLRLFDFGETYLDDMLADHYGLPRPDGGEGWVEYGDSGRAGILAHGSVLSAFSKFTDTSPTQRGKFVRTRLLCQVIPRPPANVAADKPPTGMNAVCKYDRYLEHRASASCASCHDQMDPIGFGLERFDVAGRYRENDDGLPECAIDGQGEVVGYGTFNGPAELGKLLLDNDLVQGCVVQQLGQFALGRAPTAADRPLLDALEQGFEGTDYAFGQLLTSYVQSEAFALRREPEVMP